jgi:hypothetical protein
MEPDDAVTPWAPPTWEAPVRAARRRGSRDAPQVPGLVPRRRSWWFYLGVAGAVALAIAGLALIGVIIVAAIGLSQWGNNK